MLALSVAALLGSAAPGGLMAQDAATLIADRLEIAADSRLIAEGSVEVFYQGRRLTAQRIVFDQTADRLTIEGPIRLTDAEDGIPTLTCSIFSVAASFDPTHSSPTHMDLMLTFQSLPPLCKKLLSIW